MEQSLPLTSSTAAVRPFRFGIVAAAARSGAEWIAKARRAESLGYTSLLMPDNLQYTLAPFPALAMVAAATRTLRIGTYVLANDLRNPVLLAKDVATLDLLSDGRFELGLGAGRPDSAAENRMLGVPFDSGAVRVARLAESLQVLKTLLAGERVSTSGSHYSVVDAEVSPRPLQKPRPPILVAATARQLLSVAAREADIIALGLPPDASEAMLAERIGWIRAAAGDRFAQIELNINLMSVAGQLPQWVASHLHLTAQDLADRGSVAAINGTAEAMCEQLIQRRARFGLSYIVVSDEFMELFAPVVEHLSGG
jgi:probable F420-dependent oxidoreductase